jgi:glycosyltransferase involved in cell wall biosynthesis
MVACLKPQKCPQDFIRLAALVRQKMPQVKFILIGDGILRQEIEQLIRRHQLDSTVILAGWRKDIWRAISALDVFVLTSLWEGLPIAALEAMLSAKPVVATDTGGIAEIINDGESGFLIPAHGMQDMAGKLVFLLQDTAARHEMGCKARDSLVGRYAVKTMCDDTDAVYAAVMREKGLIPQ